MTKTLAFWIIGCFGLSIGVVAGLLALSKDIREQPGSFLRQYPPHPVVESAKIELDDEHYYFAGAAGSHVYLANTVRPLDLLELNTDMSDTSKVHLQIDGIEGTRFFRIKVAIDSPYFYFMDGPIPYMYRGNMSNWIGTQFKKDSAYFIDAIPISYNSFAIRAISTKTHGYALGKMIVNTKRPVRLNLDLLQRQIDGIFDVDGTFTYDKQMNRLVYVYFYRNQYIAMDTNLNLQYRGNTIDTFKIAHIRTAEVYSDRSKRLSAPPITTNKSHDTYKDLLLIHSLLPAKNEYMKRFNKASVIDVYNLSSKQYQFSFYVYNTDGEKMREFIVLDDNLYTLFKHSIKKFDLIDRYFKETVRIDQE